VLPNFMSYTLLRVEINVRASTIIGAVGGGGIGEELKLSISRGFGAKTLALVLLLFVTILIVDQFSAWLRRRLVGEQAFLFRAEGSHDRRRDGCCRAALPRSVPPAAAQAPRPVVPDGRDAALSRLRRLVLQPAPGARRSPLGAPRPLSHAMGELRRAAGV